MSVFRILSKFLAAVILILLAHSAVDAQQQNAETYEVRRAQAVALYSTNRMVDALPLLQKLHAEKPGDLPVLEALSFATASYAVTLADESAQREQRALARKLVDEAIAAGDTSNILKVMLEIPPDGSLPAPFSKNVKVEALMQEGEVAFAKGDFDAAIADYWRALVLDPHQYFASLFTGDVFFKKKDYAQAGMWFRQAIEIDPNLETAYRYWGDALTAQGRDSEAKEQFIGAVVAEPYNQRSWIGLSQWAKKQKLALVHPQIVSPNKIEAKDNGNTNIIIDAATLSESGKKDGTDSWFLYSLLRAGWHGDKFKKEFPQEKAYRHSLPEEVEGLQAVANQLKEKLEKKQIKQLEPSLATLLKLSDEGLLEAYVLISRPDQGIAQDYPGYRNAHREKIRQYISEWIIRPAP